MIRKLAGYAVLAFLLYYAFTNPTDAAGFLHGLANGVKSFAAALAGGGQ